MRWGPVASGRSSCRAFRPLAPRIAGALRMARTGFLLAAAVGAGLWAGLALGAGWLMKDTVQAVIDGLEANAGRAVGIGAGAAATVWLGWKLWQKYRLRHAWCRW